MLRKLISSTMVVVLTVLLGPTSIFAVKPPPTTNQTPVVTTFDVAANSASPVPVLTFTATDADGDQTITGYLITETSAKPSANAGGWAPTAPTQYVTSSVGLLTLYAWAKDDKDAVSDSSSDTVTIPPPPINADTLDWKHASEFAAATHDHDGTYQQKYANVVVVAKSGGDFIDPIAAINSINDASAANPYLIKIMPGIYDLGSGTLQMKPFVDIEGSGEEVTVVRSAASFEPAQQAVGAVNGASNAEVRFLTIENNGTGASTYGILNWIASPRLTHVTVRVSSGSAGCGIYSHGNNGAMSDVTIIVAGIASEAYGIRNDWSSPPMTNVKMLVSSTGHATGLGLTNCSSSISNLTADVSGGGGQNALGISADLSPATMTNVRLTVAGGDRNFGVYSSRSAATMADFTVTVSGGSETDAFWILGGPAIMRDIVAKATGGTSINCGVRVWGGPSLTLTDATVSVSGAGATNTALSLYDGILAMTNVTASALGEGASYGLMGSNQVQDGVLIDRSTIEGTVGSVYNGGPAPMKIGASKLVGPVSGAALCAGTYNGSLATLDSACQ